MGFMFPVYLISCCWHLLLFCFCFYCCCCCLLICLFLFVCLYYGFSFPKFKFKIFFFGFVFFKQIKVAAHWCHSDNKANESVENTEGRTFRMLSLLCNRKLIVGLWKIFEIIDKNVKWTWTWTCYAGPVIHVCRPLA